MYNFDTTRLQRLALNDQGFAFDPQTGESFTLNSSARLLVRNLVAGMPYAEAVTRLAGDFNLSEREASRDLLDFMEQLRTLQLLGTPA